ncbi:MAG: PAS domain-containing protein [Alphaproteobacteria bacterium]|nr:PAS domain-containing protein [Alphaproteobacteria bacterium]
MPRREGTPWRPGALGTRVLAAFLSLSLVPLVVAALVGTWQSTHVVDQLLSENVGKTASAWAADLDLFLGRQRERLEAVPVLGARPEPVLAAAVTADPSLLGLMVIDPEGAVVADTGTPAWGREACRTLATGSDRVMTHAGEGHAHEVVVAVARPEGLLCGHLTFTLHQQMLSERANSTVQGTAYIVDRDGEVVCHAFEEHEAHVERGRVLSGDAARVAAIGRPWSGEVGSGEEAAFAAFAPSRRLPWGVWVEVPRDVAAAPLRASMARVFGISAALALLAAVVAWWLVRRLIGPIQDVVSAVREVREGQYGAEIPVRGADEVAELADEFNRMSRALAASYAELDDRVARRTRDLDAARQFSDLLLDTMQERILVVDGDLTIVRANAAARTVYGADIVGCGCKSVHGRVGDADVCPARKVLETGEATHEERIVDRDGRMEVLSVDTYPLPDGETVVEISRDVTELKQMQAQLMHQEKMASLGTLAAGMAHEIGNPLASMSSELELLERLWDPEAARASLPVLRDQIRRMSKLLRELVEFGRRPAEASATLSPGELVQDVARLLRHDPRAKEVDLIVDAPPGIALLCSSRDRLMQVLVNLGINALDALGGQGHLWLSVSDAEPGRVQFEVRDDGPGLDASAARQAFDPFFTTKAPGEGTGLGLFVSQRIVGELGGRIELATSPEGTTFTVILPDCNCGEARDV